MPVTWVDQSSPVNAANLETMEADIAAKQTSAEKGAANGYAPLDASSKVPLVNLPPVSGVDYIGAWGAGTPYKKGDVVRYGGNDYMAVNDSTGVTPPAAFVPAMGVIGYGTTLPVAPFDGQEFILVDSVTAPNYQWRFRYNAQSTWGAAYAWEYMGGDGAGLTLPSNPRHGVEWLLTDSQANPTYAWRMRYNAASSSPYKWEFVGGAPAVAYIDTYQQWTQATSPADLQTVGPSVTVPHAGEYLVHGGVRELEATVSGRLANVYVKVGAASAVHLATYQAGVANQKLSMGLFGRGRMVALANDLIKLQYSVSDAAAAAYFSGRVIEVNPVRVS